MTNSDQHQNTPIINRRQRLSTTVDRRAIAQSRSQTMLNRSSETIVRQAKPQAVPTPVKVHLPQKSIAQPAAKTTPPVIKTPKLVTPARPTAQQIKETAIEKAIASTAKSDFSEKPQKSHLHFSVQRILLALTCAAAAVFAIVYFVNLNAPNISLKVAAMQSGIEASYPSYVPRDFNLSDITSENGKISLTFKNTSSDDNFKLIEEKSSWDSNALLNNYVREVFGEDYVVMREQGLTIYISDSDAAWVNGGVVYKLSANSGSLTKKQIRSIAVSL